MDAGKVADVLEERAMEAHGHNIDDGYPCRGMLKDCPRRACGEAVALVAELRAEAASRIAPCACDPALMQACSTPTCGGWAPSVASDNDPQAALQRAALPVHAAVEGAPKVRATFGKVAGFCVVPGCAAEAIRPSLRYCEAHNDLTGRSA